MAKLKSEDQNINTGIKKKFDFWGKNDLQNNRFALELNFENSKISNSQEFISSKTRLLNINKSEVKKESSNFCKIIDKNQKKDHFSVLSNSALALYTNSPTYDQLKDKSLFSPNSKFNNSECMPD